MAPRNNNPFQPKDLDPTLAAMGPRSAIELKNLSHNVTFSEETHCFSASVYINGKRMFSASNRGCGGPNEYSSLGHRGELSDNLRYLPERRELWIKKDKEAFEESMSLAREEAKQYTLKKIELGEDLQWAIDAFASEDEDGNPSQSNELIDWLIADLINEQLTLKEMRKTLKKKVTVYDPKSNDILHLGRDKPTDEILEKYKAHFILQRNDKNAKDWVWLNMIPEAEAYKYWRTAS